MKKHFMLLMVLILCGITGCKNGVALSDLEKFKERTEMEEKNMALARGYVDALNTRDFDLLNEFLSPDYSIYSPSGYPEPTSRDKLIENYTATKEAFPQFIWSIEDIVASNDKVICRIIINGTFNGEIPNLPAGEKEFKFSMITIMRMEDDKIIEEWQEDDQLGFVRQLGMELKPKELDD